MGKKNKRYCIFYNDKSASVIVRNIRLTNINDEDYVLFCRNNAIKRKEKRIETTEKDCSLLNYEKLSNLLEDTIFHWTNSSKNRILCWEELGWKKLWRTRYSEIDFIVEKDEKNIVIGEVKTKLYRNKKGGNKSNIGKRESLLKCLRKIKFDYYLVKIFMEDEKDLLKDCSGFLLHDFKSNFFDMDLYEHVRSSDFTIKSINLRVKDVFNYGLEIGTIKDPEFLNKVYEEIKIREDLNDIELIEDEIFDEN